MINIDKFKKFVDFLANKNGKGSNPTPSNFNIAVEQSVMEWTMKRYNNPQEYQAGRPIPRISYEITQKIIDDLHHLKETKYFNVDNGTVFIPNGSSVTDIYNTVAPKYLHLTALRSVIRFYKNNVAKNSELDIEIVRDNQWGRRLESSIKAPSKRYPIANIQSNFIEIMPKEVQMIRMVYLRYPNTPSWAYTIQNNRPVYDSINSVDIDAPEEALNEIAMSCLSFLGINIRETDLVQYAETLKAKGV